MIGNSKTRELLEQIKLDAEVSLVALRFFQKTKKQFFRDFADTLIARINRLRKNIYE